MLLRTQTLQTVAFLDLLGAGLIVPRLAPHARQLGCDHLLVGLMGALYSAGQLISGPMTGTLTDIRDKKTMLLLSVSISGLAYILLGITSSIVLFLGLRAFLGIFKHTQVLTKALVPEYEKEQSQSSVLYGRLGTLSAVGMCLGPIISGHIMETFPENGFTLIAMSVGTIFAVNSALLRQLPEERTEKNKEKTKTENVAAKLMQAFWNKIKHSANEFYQIDWNTYSEPFLFHFLISLSLGVYFCNFALYLNVKHHISPSALGYLTSFLWATQSFFVYFIEYVYMFYEDDKDFTRRNCHVYVVLTVCLIGMSLAPTVSTYIFFAPVLAISGVVGRSVALDLIANKGENQKSTVLGAASSVRSITNVLCPLTAGIVGQYVGSLYVIYVSVILTAIAAYRSYNNRSKSIIARSKSE